jgi:hypothetical protein
LPPIKVGPLHFNIMNEQGFYKLEVGAKRSIIIFSDSKLENKNWILDIALKDTYDYPVDDWYYFDSLDEACTAFNVNSEDYREDIFPSEHTIISEDIFTTNLI